MEVVCTAHKGGHSGIIEKYYIYCETTRGTQNESTVSRNRIFDVAVHHDS
jgi:hypothetical protein